MDQTSSTPGPDDRSGETAALAANVLTTVERQLTRYFATIAQRVDESLQAAQATRDDVGRQLADIAQKHAARMAEFDSRLAALAAQPAGVSPDDLMQIRQAMREDIWKSLGPVTERLDALSDANKRTDEQAHALVQHVNTTTATLVTRIDEGDQRVTKELEGALADARGAVDARTAAIDARVSELAASTGARVTEVVASADTRILELAASTDTRITELAASTDTRISEVVASNDTRISEVVASTDTRITELAASTDARFAEVVSSTEARADSLAAEIAAATDLATEAAKTAGARLGDLEKRLGTLGLDLATLATRVEGIDQDAIEDLKSQMSAAIGEAMLVRIELDRVVAATDEKIDKTTVRLGEIEALLTDEMDVGAAVQLERLDELERAVMMLDPAQFVRKDELLTESSGSTVNSAGLGADGSRSEQSLHGGPDAETFDHGSHDSTYDSGSSEGAYSASEAWS